MENINESIAISQRFFEALEQLIRTGRVKSVSEFGKRYGHLHQPGPEAGG